MGSMTESKFIKQAVTLIPSLSHVQLFVTPWTTAHQASLSFSISQSLLKLMSSELMMETGLDQY